jgi:type VI protein secretion system component Hcp
MRADSDEEPIKYYEVELENVIIGSIDQVMHGGMGLHDNFTLKWKYTQQKIAGEQVAILWRLELEHQPDRLTATGMEQLS